MAALLKCVSPLLLVCAGRGPMPNEDPVAYFDYIALVIILLIFGIGVAHSNDII